MARESHYWLDGAERLEAIAKEYDVTSIHLVNMELDVAGASPNHNYISFRDAGGREVAAMHGFTTDRETGYMGETTLTGDTTLRVEFKTGQENSNYIRSYIENTFPEVIENYENAARANDPEAMKETLKDFHDVHTVNEPLWEGTPEEGRQKLAMAMDGGNFINSQNIDYDAVRVFSEAQNSNSVAHSLVKAMELEVPDGQEGFAPGHDRILLSDNFKSGYSFDANPMEHTMVIDHLATNVLSGSAVRDQVIEDQGGQTTDTFDPARPLNSYTMPIYDTPFEIDDYEGISLEYASRMDGSFHYGELDDGFDLVAEADPDAVATVETGVTMVSQDNAQPTQPVSPVDQPAVATSKVDAGLDL